MAFKENKSTISDKTAFIVDWSIVTLVFISGVLHPSPAMFYNSMGRIFAIIIIPLLGASFLLYRFSAQFGTRVQGERKSHPPIAREIFGTTRATFIVACMGAWPVAMYRMGLPTGMAWTIQQMGISWWLAILEMYLGIVAIDAMTYWKHRLLHTRMFFAFHKHHHTFRDPTPFTCFAVGPMETILTFWPLMFICFPAAKHFAPFYFSAITGFVLLNLYLHCGVTYTWLEKLLTRINLNTSGWHNVHHSDVNVNFGEVSHFWDKVCKTTKADKLAKKQAQKIMVRESAAGF